MLPFADSDAAINCKGVRPYADVVDGERFDADAEIVRHLCHRREADAKSIQHGCLTHPIDTDDEVEARLEVELGRLDSPEIGEFEACDDYGVHPMSS